MTTSGSDSPAKPDGANSLKARVPVEVDYGSEFRYRAPVMTKGTLVLALTQSGKTSDTLAAMRMAKERGGRVLALVNVLGSPAEQLADGRWAVQLQHETQFSDCSIFIRVYLCPFVVQMASLRPRETEIGVTWPSQIVIK